jgi:hypothetical protein
MVGRTVRSAREAVEVELDEALGGAAEGFDADFDVHGAGFGVAEGEVAERAVVVFEKAEEMGV